MNEISSYFMPASKKIKSEEEEEEIIETIFDPIKHETDAGAACDQEEGNAVSDLPDCWTLMQKNDFCQRNDWLFVRDRKLGCKVCRDVWSLSVEKQMGIKISAEWANCRISHFGKSRKQKLMSLRKKIYDHKESGAHKTAQKVKIQAKNEPLEKIFQNTLPRNEDITAKVFRTAYKVAKNNQAFNSFEDEINLQELNGLDMGCILHSTNACINIVNHIADEMRKTLLSNIVNSKNKISLVINESTTVSNRTTLIVIVRVVLPGHLAQANLFLDLIELEDDTAGGIFSSLICYLQSLGISEDYLKEYLLSVTCDGAAALLGIHSDFKMLMQEKFPGVIFCHCTNRRLELSVSDTVNKVAGVNRSKSFVDKLNVIHHASSRNARELQECAAAVELQLLKIGRSSLLIRTTSALMFIRMVGPPLSQFNPTKYVESWLLSGRHSAVDIKSKKRSREDEGTSEDMVKVWALL